MRRSIPLIKLLVVLAICPSLAAAEGLWSGLKAGAGSAYERGRALSLDALATGADLAARGLDHALTVTEDASAFFIREGTPDEQRAMVDDLAFGTRFWPDEALNQPDLQPAATQAPAAED
jgi:hypothetical protein